MTLLYSHKTGHSITPYLPTSVSACVQLHSPMASAGDSMLCMRLSAVDCMSVERSGMKRSNTSTAWGERIREGGVLSAREARGAASAERVR